MLPVERRDELARVKVRQADDLDFGKTKSRFDGGRDRPGFRIVHAAAEDRRHLDLDRDAVRLHEEFADDLLGGEP